MGYDWASLYLVACDLLGDESLAGDLLMQARSEADLVKRLERMAPLPYRLPEPPADVVELVAVLRRRAQRRRRTAATWAVAAAVATVASVTALLAGPFSTPVAAQYQMAPVVTVERDGLVLEVHEVDAGPDGLTAWWSLSGPDAGEDATEVEVAVQTPTGIITAGRFDTVTRPARRDWLLGRTHLPDLVLPVRQEVVLLFELGQRQWVVGVVPERRALEAVERRTPVNQVIDDGGVGVFVKAVVTSPRYTVVEWEPWIAPEVAHTLRDRVGIIRLETDSGPMHALGGEWARFTHFGPLPAQTGEVRLLSNRILREETVSLPVQPGAEDSHTSLRVEGTVRQGDTVTVEFSGAAAGTEITMARLEDGQGTVHWPANLTMRQVREPGDRHMRYTARFEVASGVTPLAVHVKMVREFPPLAMSVILQP